jgi:hypothetical protein
VGNPGGSQTIAQPPGTMFNVNRFEAIRFADQFGTSKSDCATRINLADLDLGKFPGEIWVSQACGLTFSTAINLGANGANHILRFIQGGTFTVATMISLSGVGASIICTSSLEAGNGYAIAGPCILKEADNANLPALIKMTGGANVIQGITVNANCPPSNIGAGPCHENAGYGIWIDACTRCGIESSQVQYAFSHGIQIESTTWPNNESGGAVVFKSQAVFNGGDGVRLQNTADVNILESQLDSNLGQGLNAINSPTFRITKSDVGGNGFNGSISTNANGVTETCNIVTQVSGGGMIVGNQIGNNSNHQIFINAWDSVHSAQCTTAQTNVIVGNEIFNNLHNPPDSFDGILIENSANNTISGNTITEAGTGVKFKYPIEFLGPDFAEGQDVVVGNMIAGAGRTNATYGQCNFARSTIADGNGNCSSQFLNNIVLGPGAAIGTINGLTIANVAPTISSGFGMAPAIATNNGTASFTIMVGTGGTASSGVIHLQAARNGWNCYASDLTHPATALTRQSAVSADSATLTNYNNAGMVTPWIAGDVLSASCFGR